MDRQIYKSETGRQLHAKTYFGSDPTLEICKSHTLMLPTMIRGIIQSSHGINAVMRISIILVVDDDSMNLVRTKMILGKYYDVLFAESGEEALDKLKKEKRCDENQHYAEHRDDDGQQQMSARLLFCPHCF